MKIGKKINRLILTDEQRSLIRDCKIANREEHSQWFLNNVLFPLIVILFPLLMFFFIPSNIESWDTLIFNGSLSLLGINILFSMSSYLIKFQKFDPDKKEGVEGDTRGKKKLSERMYHLRSRLDLYKNILIFAGGILYFSQVFLITPDTNMNYYIFALITIIILVISMYIGRYMFIIRDDFLQKTFYKEVHDPVMKNKNRWEDKYGQA